MALGRIIGDLDAGRETSMHKDNPKTAPHELQALPNIGPKMAAALQRIGVTRPDDLAGRDPEHLYLQLGELEERYRDPCVLDTLTAVVEHLNGAPARPWWFYSRRRKAEASPG